MRSFLTLAVLSCSSLALSGCLGDPMPMPRGYYANKDVYKSAPGPEARDVGYEYSNDKNMAVNEQIVPAAQDLVAKLDNTLSFSSDEIFLRMPRHMAFFNAFDHALRQELIQSGYVLSHDQEHAVVVDFVALESDCAGHMYLALAMGLDEKKKPSQMVGGFYDVPKYDFVTGEVVDLVVPPCTGDVDPMSVQHEVSYDSGDGYNE